MNASFRIIPTIYDPETKMCKPIVIDSLYECNMGEIAEGKYTKILEYITKRRFRALAEQSKYEGFSCVELRSEEENYVPKIIVSAEKFRHILTVASSGYLSDEMNYALNKVRDVDNIAFVILIPRKILHLI